MAFKVFAGGATLSAADLNDYLMEQSIIVCTSGTRPLSPAEGWTIYETDTDLYLMYSGSAWVTLTQPGAWTAHTTVVAGGVGGTWTLAGGSVSRYRRVGRDIHWTGKAIYSSSTATGVLYLTSPVTLSSTTNGLMVGQATGYDSSAALLCHADVVQSSTTLLSLEYVAGTGPTGLATNFYIDPSGPAHTPWQWAANDYIRWDVTLEAAT